MCIRDRDRIVTSGQATISYLKKHYPGKRVYLLGNDLLQREFQEEGILLAENDPEVVVTGFDTSLTYEKLCRVCDHVRAGLPYIATHPDYNCPTAVSYTHLDSGIFDAKQLGVPKMLILGVQHMFAMFGATVIVPALTGLDAVAYTHLDVYKRQQ